MKAKLTFLLTAWMMLFTNSANAQESSGPYNGQGTVIYDNVDDIAKVVMDGSNDLKGDVNGDGKVDAIDIVEFVNMATVKIEVKNTSPQAITINPYLNFVLNDVGAIQYAYFGEAGSSVVINSEETKVFDNVKVPKGKLFSGKTFAAESELAGNPSNAILYAVGGKSLATDLIDAATEFVDGGTYTIVYNWNPLATVPVINFNLTIKNQSPNTVDLSGKLTFVLGNPTKDGTYIGWNGTHVDEIIDLGEAVQLAANEEKTFTNVTFKEIAKVGGEDVAENGIEGECGLGGRSPIDPRLLESVRRPANVIVYDPDGNAPFDVQNLESDIVFAEGGTYEIIILSSPAPEPVRPDYAATVPVINCNLVVKNSTENDVNLNGIVKFVLANPTSAGTYVGWTGNYNDTDPINLGGPVSLAAGQTSQTFSLNYSELAQVGSADDLLLYDAVEIGLGGRSPLDPQKLEEIGRIANVIVQDADGVETTYRAENMATVSFVEGGTYTINIVSSPNPVQEPEPQTDFAATVPVINFSLTLNNRTANPVDLNGKVKLVLGNPTQKGTYVGWDGRYVDEEISLGQSVHLDAYGSTTISNLTYSETAKVGGADINEHGVDAVIGLGGRSPLNPALFATVGRTANVIVTDLNGLDATYGVENLGADIVFEEGGTYEIDITSSPNTTPEPAPAPQPTVNPVPVIGVNLVIKNSTGGTANLNGEVVFVLGNPNKDGTYVGYSGPYVRTPHITFSAGGASIDAGESRTFSNVTYSEEAMIGGADCETNGTNMTIGLGNRSPLNEGLLSIAGRASNVLLYDVGGVSETYLVRPMSSDIVFEDGKTYELEIVSAPVVNPTPTPSQPTGSSGSVVTFYVQIVNQSSRTLYLAGDLKITLSNPMRDGRYVGWNGPYNGTRHIVYCSGGLTLGPGQTSAAYPVTYSEVAEIMGEGEQVVGLGGRSPISNPALAGRLRNILVYDNKGVSETYLPNNWSPDIIFKDGETYQIVIP